MSEANVTATADASAGATNDAGSGESSVDLADFKTQVESIANAEDAAPSDAKKATTDAKADAGKTGTDEKSDEAEAGEKVETDGKFKATARQADMAKQLGLTDEQIALLTPELAAVFETAALRQSQAMSKLGRKQQELDGKGKGEGADAETGDESGDSESSLFTDDDFETTEAVLGKLNPMVTQLRALAGLVKSQGAALEELRAAKVDSDTETQYDTVDRFFGGLDAETFTQFGEGAAVELDAEGDEYKARDALCAKASDIRAGYALLHDGEEMSLESALNEALLIVSAKQLETHAGNKVKDAIKKRSSQRISRPTHQAPRAENLSEEEAAEKQIREKAALKGIHLPA